MQVQRTLTKNRKFDPYFDLLELITGLVLVGFLWTHLFFESTIVIGTETFDNLSQTLDQTILPYLGIPLIVLAFFTHFIVVGRRIPTRFQEQRIIWRHAKSLNHPNTWAWIYQIFSGMLLLILGSIHIWVIVTDWPIEATNSAARVASSYWIFYILLLLLAISHAGIGLYRQFVKWSWFPRKPVSVLISIISLIITGIGLATILAFIQLGGLQ